MTEYKEGNERQKMEEVLTRVAPELIEVFGETNIVLAGGALRDLEHDVPVKDYDFFVKPDSFGKEIDIEVFSEMVFKNLREFEIKEGSMGKKCAYFKSKVFGTPVEVIPLDYDGLTWEQTICNNFDVDFCKIYFDLSEYKMYRTPEYATDREEKKITVRFNADKDKNNPYKTFVDHIPRLIGKYSDHQIRMVAGGRWYYVSDSKSFRTAVSSSSSKPPWSKKV